VTLFSVRNSSWRGSSCTHNSSLHHS